MANMKVGLRILAATSSRSQSLAYGVRRWLRKTLPVCTRQNVSLSRRGRKGRHPDGKEDGTADFASPEVQKMSGGELTAVIADGKNKMPSYKKSLKAEQVKELVGYIRSLARNRIDAGASVHSCVYVAKSAVLIQCLWPCTSVDARACTEELTCTFRQYCCSR